MRLSCIASVFGYHLNIGNNSKLLLLVLVLSTTDPYLVKFFGISKSHTTNPPRIYIVMEWCDQTLSNVLRDSTTVPLPSLRLTDYRWICLMGARIAAGLNFLHTIGVVHRDIKPENILLKFWSAIQCPNMNKEKRDLEKVIFGDELKVVHDVE